MSIIDINQLSPIQLITQYVVETLGSGHCLSRDDAARVESWVKMAPSSDELMVLLEELLPQKVEKARQGGRKVTSLGLVHKTVQKRLLERSRLAGGLTHDGSGN
jgi:hypothetical protein